MLKLNELHYIDANEISEVYIEDMGIADSERFCRYSVNVLKKNCQKTDAIISRVFNKKLDAIQELNRIVTAVKNNA